MAHWFGGGSGGTPAPLVTVGGQAPPSQPRSNPVTYSDASLEELIALARQQGVSRFGSRNPYLDNLLYIQANPPRTREQVQGNDIGMDDVLDIVGYASAIASFIPYPPIAIGGRIGYLATGVGRALSRGDSRGAARQIDRLYNEMYRMSRQRAYSGQGNRRKVGGKRFRT